MEQDNESLISICERLMNMPVPESDYTKSLNMAVMGVLGMPKVGRYSEPFNYAYISGEDFCRITENMLAEKLHYGELSGKVVVHLDTDHILDEQELEAIRDEWRERE